jgi:hypothetical protein
MICIRCGTVFCYDGDSVPESPTVKTFCGNNCKSKYGHRRRVIVRAVNRIDRDSRSRGLPATGLPVCPRSSKVSHASRKAATAVAVLLGRDLRSYECPWCGHWHHAARKRRACRTPGSVMTEGENGS